MHSWAVSARVPQLLRIRLTVLGCEHECVTVSRDGEPDAACCPGKAGARWESGQSLPI